MDYAIYGDRTQTELRMTLTIDQTGEGADGRNDANPVGDGQSSMSIPLVSPRSLNGIHHMWQSS